MLYFCVMIYDVADAIFLRKVHLSLSLSFSFTRRNLLILSLPAIWKIPIVELVVEGNLLLVA